MQWPRTTVSVYWKPAMCVEAATHNSIHGVSCRVVKGVACEIIRLVIS